MLSLLEDEGPLLISPAPFDVILSVLSPHGIDCFHTCVGLFLGSVPFFSVKTVHYIVITIAILPSLHFPPLDPLSAFLLLCNSFLFFPFFQDFMMESMKPPLLYAPTKTCWDSKIQIVLKIEINFVITEDSDF